MQAVDESSFDAIGQANIFRVSKDPSKLDSNFNPYEHGQTFDSNGRNITCK